MGVWLGPMGSNKVSFITEDDYEYTNKSTASVYFNDVQGVNWEIVLKKGGILKFKKNPGAIDIFMVGGGSSGVKGSAEKIISLNTRSATGGNGGQGGQCKFFNLENSSISRNKLYEIKIGDGGKFTKNTGSNTTIVNGGSTTFKINDATTLTALGGGETGCTGAIGGTGAAIGTNIARTLCKAGNPGTFAFEAENASIYSPSIRYGASGGGGCARYWKPGDGYYPACANERYPYAAVGGESYGGAGGWTSGDTDAVSSTGGDATLANTGAGGGGGVGEWNQDDSNKSTVGGAGAAGIIIIRNHRSS